MDALCALLDCALGFFLVYAAAGLEMHNVGCTYFIWDACSLRSFQALYTYTTM